MTRFANVATRMCLIKGAISREPAAIMRCMRFNEYAQTNSRKCVSTLAERYRFSEHSPETGEREIGARNLQT